jgi:hypothetical protein
MRSKASDSKYRDWDGYFRKAARTSFVAPEELMAKIRKAAKDENTSVSAFLCRLADDYLKTKRR